MLKSCGTFVMLMVLVSCIPTNQESISGGFNQQSAEIPTSVSYSVFPFALPDFPGAMTASNYHTQPISLSISGDCRGLLNSQLSISDENEVDHDNNDGIGVDSAGYLSFGPKGFLYSTDSIKELQLVTSAQQYYAPQETDMDVKLYASMLDCQNSGTFKFTLVGQEDYSKIITQNCSHDEPFRFRINGINKSGNSRSLLYSVKLTRQQCEKLNPCDSEFNIGTNNYPETSKIYGLKQLLTGNIIGDVDNVDNSFYAGFYEEKNSPVIACNAEQLFNLSNGYSVVMKNSGFYDSDVYLFDDIDGGNTLYHPIGEPNSFDMTNNFNGFGHSITNLIIEPSQAGNTAQLFYKVYNYSSVQIKNFKLYGNEFSVNPTNFLPSLPGLALITLYDNISASSGSGQVLSNIEVFENDIFFNTGFTPASISGCASTVDVCISDFYNNPTNSKDKSPLIYSTGSDFAMLRIEPSVKAFGNSFHYFDLNSGSDEYLFDLYEQ